MHLAIEGNDGVGKSTICNLLSKKLNYIFVEKPMHYLLDEDGIDNYQKLAIKVNSMTDRNFTAWYYALNNMLTYSKFKDQNIVTDRHLVSNFCYSGTTYNEDIYDLLIKKIGLPDLTVILYANQETITKRLIKRNPTDNDLKKVDKSEDVYKRMIKFCDDKKCNYIVVDTSNNEPEITVDIIISKLMEVINGNK
ncbi:MAG: AAA family ATPase [bacterium]